MDRIYKYNPDTIYKPNGGTYIREFIYMLPSDMNLRIGKVKNYNYKILISSPSFDIETVNEVSTD